MLDLNKIKNWDAAIIVLLIVITLLGIFFRILNITDDVYVYYDEGLYLRHNIDFLYFMEKNPPNTLSKVTRYLEIMAHVALMDAKFVWFFIANLRGFFVGVNGNFFLRVVSSIFGSLSLLIVYLFGKKYYKSRFVGILSMALLAILPSHVYYSRLGMQEAFSTFCFLLGMYFYVFSKERNYKTFISGLFFSLVFFVNYRMIIIPVIVIFTEMYMSFSEKRKMDLKKLVWSITTFLSIIFLIGNIDNGANTRITFSWMFHQAHLAKGHASLINFLSYPYYIFKLESILFGILFFGNVYYIYKKEWQRMLPFTIVCFQMIIFSLPQEKGTRYLCSSMPFMALSVASLIGYFNDNLKNVNYKKILIALVAVLLIDQIFVSNSISRFRNDYKNSIIELKEETPNARICSTQFMVQKLFVKNRSDVIATKKDFKQLFSLYKRGFRYIIVDPQAYISYTKDEKRLSFENKLL